MATAKKSAPKVKKDLSSYCYTVRQASQLLNLSPKRVRQMITEGKLTKVNESPVLVEMREVLALRDQREADPRYRKQPPPDQVTQLLENFQKIIASVEEMNQKAITMRDEAQARNEENYLNQINQLKADLEAERARRWFKKR